MKFNYWWLACILLIAPVPCTTFENASLREYFDLYPVDISMIESADSSTPTYARQCMDNLSEMSEETNEISMQDYAVLVSRLSHGKIEPEFRMLPIPLRANFHMIACDVDRPSCLGDNAKLPSFSEGQDSRTLLRHTCAYTEETLRSMDLLLDLDKEPNEYHRRQDIIKLVATQEIDTTCHFDMMDSH
eukprot:scaffold169621_cov46-Attheya_sp.AAC.3